MLKTLKCLEYYMDSKEYTVQDIEKSINATKQDFAKQDIDVEVELNDFGVYVITFYFKCKNSFLKEIVLKIKSKIRFNRVLLIGDGSKKDKKSKKYYTNKQYGSYKQTKEYRPY